jgi:alpha-glucosidase (family GH31 glycosyl hydrolase)
VPGERGGNYDISVKTVPMELKQSIGDHYHLHNMYGWSETVATKEAMEAVRGKRAVVISRSTFPSSGAYGGHWLGDNDATWDDLYYSIPGVLSMGLYGIPFIGPDTCGFGGDSNAELCTRWMQVSSFFPFYRNHNTIGTANQAPYVWGEPYTSYIRTAMQRRYTHLPYMYTVMHEAHVTGLPVARSLMQEFPDGDLTVIPNIDRQYMVGDSILICPVTHQGVQAVRAYLPEGVWYDTDTGAPLQGFTVPGWNTFPAPLDTLVTLYRGGSVVVTQPVMTALTTTEQLKQPYTVVAALDASGSASGQLYLDDGETIGAFEKGQYTSVQYTVAASGHAGSLTAQVTHAQYDTPASAVVSDFKVLGVSTSPSTVVVNGKVVSSGDWSYDSSTLVLAVSSQSLGHNQTYTLSWK